MRMGKRLSEMDVHQSFTDTEYPASDIDATKYNAALQQLLLAANSDHETRARMLAIAKQILQFHQLEQELLNNLESTMPGEATDGDYNTFDKLKDALHQIRTGEKRQIKTLRMGR